MYSDRWGSHAGNGGNRLIGRTGRGGDMSDDMQPEVAHQTAATGEGDTSMALWNRYATLPSRGTGC